MTSSCADRISEPSGKCEAPPIWNCYYGPYTVQSQNYMDFCHSDMCCRMLRLVTQKAVVGKEM